MPAKQNGEVGSGAHVTHRVEDTWQEFAARMRAKLPHVAAEDLSNALVSAYCEALKAQGETDPTATSKLRTFARATYERLAQQRTRKFKDATSIR
jgi:hypothetical protein